MNSILEVALVSVALAGTAVACSDGDDDEETSEDAGCPGNESGCPAMGGDDAGCPGSESGCPGSEE
jgi:hypothetical protein